MFAIRLFSGANGSKGEEVATFLGQGAHQVEHPVDDSPRDIAAYGAYKHCLNFCVIGHYA